MIEALKDMVEIVKHLPEYTIWVLIGLLAYKLFVVGSIYGCIRLAINRLSEYLMRERVEVVKFDLEGHFLSKADKHALLALLEALKYGYGGSSTNYISSAAMNDLREAVEKIKIEKKSVR